jgi:hypothetical protein
MENFIFEWGLSRGKAHASGRSNDFEVFVD